MFGELSSASPLPLSENLCFLEVLVLLSSLSSHLVLVSGSRLETGCNSNVDVRRHDEPAKLLTMIVLTGEVEWFTRSSGQQLSNRETGRHRFVSGSDFHML